MSLWVINHVCYRCSNSGVIPYLKIEKYFDKNFNLSEFVFKCDCPKGDKKHKSLTYYSDKFGDDHQFYFTLELVRNTEPKITYIEAYTFFRNEIHHRIKHVQDGKVGVNSDELITYLERANRIKRELEEVPEGYRPWWN